MELQLHLVPGVRVDHDLEPLTTSHKSTQTISRASYSQHVLGLYNNADLLLMQGLNILTVIVGTNSVNIITS